MSRAIFSLLTFQGSSASCLFILHDLISVAGEDESTMNPGLRLCTALPRARQRVEKLVYAPFYVPFKDLKPRFCSVWA
jgi:hypothetical protein